MARRAAQQAAEAQARDLARLLRGHYQGWMARVPVNKHNDNVFGEVWQAKLDPPLNVEVAAGTGPLEGAWTLTSYWRYGADPRNPNTAILVESSLGINVGELTTVHPLHRPAPFCVARYDFDLHDDIPHHLNVWQGNALQDRVHWRLPLGDDAPPPWEAERVLDWFTSASFASDLHRRCAWPVL